MRVPRPGVGRSRSGETSGIFMRLQPNRDRQPRKLWSPILVGNTNVLPKVGIPTAMCHRCSECGLSVKKSSTRRSDTVWLGQCAAPVEIATPRLARIDDADDHVFPALQCVDRSGVVALVVDRRLVDFVDDGSLREADLIRERTRLDRLNQHALDAPRSELLRQVHRRDAELVRSGLFFTGSVLVRSIVLTRERTDSLGAVLDGHLRAFLLTIAQVADLGSGSGTPRGDDVHQVIAILDGFAIDRGDDVTHLDAGLFRRTALGDTRDQHAGFKTVDASDGS